MRRNQSWSGDILSSRAIGLPSFMTVAALAYPTVAAPISYVLIPLVTGGGATVVGGFTFDAIGPTLDAVGLSVTGGPQPGSYTVPVSATAAEIVAEIPSTTDRILLIFDNPLGAVPDPVSAIAFPPSAPDPAPAMGDAVPSTAEPTTLALLGGALGLFLLIGRANPRGAHNQLPKRVVRLGLRLASPALSETACSFTKDPSRQEPVSP